MWYSTPSGRTAYYILLSLKLLFIFSTTWCAHYRTGSDGPNTNAFTPKLSGEWRRANWQLAGATSISMCRTHAPPRHTYRPKRWGRLLDTSGRRSVTAYRHAARRRSCRRSVPLFWTHCPGVERPAAARPEWRRRSSACTGARERFTLPAHPPPMPTPGPTTTTLKRGHS